MGCSYPTFQLQESQLHRRKKLSLFRPDSTYELPQSFIALPGPITSSQRSLIMTTLKNHFLFGLLDYSSIQELASEFKKCTGQKQQYLFRQSNKASCFFIVGQGGMVRVEINCKQQKILKERESFGELALLYSAPRSSSIKVISQNILLFYLEQRKFREALKLIHQKTVKEARQVIEKVGIFNYLTSRQKYTLLSNLLKVRYQIGQIIFNFQDDANCLYIVASGRVKIQIPQKSDIFAHPNQYFGQGSLFTSTSSTYSTKQRSGMATAVEPTQCFTLSFQTILQVLEDNIKNLIYYNIEKWALRRSQALAYVSDRVLQRVLGVFVIMKAQRFHVIRKRNDVIQNVYIPLDARFNGTMEVKAYGMEGLIQKNKLPTSQKEDRFLERPCIDPIDFINQVKRQADCDIVVTKSGNYVFAKLEEIKKVIFLEMEMQRKMLQLSKDHQISYESELNITVKSLKFIKKLGDGQFGSVYLAQDRKFGTKLAVKKLNKKQLRDEDLLQAVIQQKRILDSINSPFIQSFYKAQSDKDSIYLILEYISGVQLLQTLRQIGILPDPICRYYLASIIIALEHLHLDNILYRDIKPQNVLVTSKGELVLIDLGTAKRLDLQSGFRTYTLIGTPHYMAPQMTQGKGYSLQIDYWAVGIILYQFLCGKLPFANLLQDPYQILREIKKKKISFPKFLKMEVVSLLKSLLNKNPIQRLRGGWKQVRSSQYMSGFDWDALERKEMQSFHIPRKFRNQSLQQYSIAEDKSFQYDSQTLQKWDQTI